ncbi:type 1 glutamine amidotransferase domain-containing protein [Aquicella lusitana]|uniref:Protease I n=1 Tax=Aquicella lusitana TaxID=254246 RepID=A0A370GJE8_9COXI|nr:type 1 glutamine amidotransferase domain-containing protein [Aquicella lusitana]RDI43366.1 protease I [Aquicella lusitana]VVC73516.1 Putative cysteine protease YraA [Aquicella lusitana]
MKKSIKKAKFAFLLCDGFEESEMTEPRKALEKAGATVHLISPGTNKVQAFRHHKRSREYPVHVKLEAAKAGDYDAVVLPGGVINPDKLRTYKKAIKFIIAFFKHKKLIAAICHGPQTLIETGKLKGYKMTSYHSIKTDLKNAGATWQNKKVIVDRNLITSRQPQDIPAFNKAILKQFGK